MIKAFIFDMDGTVIDSTGYDFNSWKIVMKEKGVDFSYQDFLALLGAKGDEIVSRFLELPPESVKALLEQKEKYFQAISSEKGLRPIPGVIDFLEIIKEKEIPMALATGAGKTKLDFVFSRIKIEKYFDVILTANDIQKGKPDPEIFLKAAEKLGFAPADCIVVEDATFGVKAAKQGGMKCLAITSTHSRESLQAADIIIDRYEDFDWEVIRK